MDDDQTSAKTIAKENLKQGQNHTAEVESESEDQGFLEALKEEWNLFWASIKGDGEDEEEESSDPFENGPYKDLSLEQVRDMKKTLSADKKRLNQRLEALKKEIDTLTARLENIKMVNGDLEATQHMMLELNDFGQNLSEQLSKIDRRLKQARDREQFLKEEQTEA